MRPHAHPAAPHRPWTEAPAFAAQGGFPSGGAPAWHEGERAGGSWRPAPMRRGYGAMRGGRGGGAMRGRWQRDNGWEGMRGQGQRPDPGREYGDAWSGGGDGGDGGDGRGQSSSSGGSGSESGSESDVAPAAAPASSRSAVRLSRAQLASGC
jgi:hypothetical protein